MISNLPDSLIKSARFLLEANEYASLLFENRIAFLKDKNPVIDISHDQTALHHQPAAIIDHIANSGDPTKKKIYTQWLLNQYKQKAFKQEDAYRLADILSNFDKYKNKLDQKDINSYKSIKDIEAAVKPHIGTGATKAETRQIERQNLHQPGHELKYDDDNISIYHLSDKDVSKKLYGKSNDSNPGVCPTQWCTATQSDEHNMFDHYLKETYPGSKLHVVHRKSDGAVFQYHPESNQFMDSEDNEISPDDFKSIAPSLHKAWRENPDLV